jgi:teichuronic acid biosynthesis glycosyltransferase TuaG
MDESLVSVVMPTYNTARFVEDAIRSVRAQTYDRWELLIADDCSCDETVTVASRWEKEDKRIHILRRAQNGGPAAARNSAIEVARGRYIAFLDSDDLWLPSKLERQIGFLRSRCAALSFTGYRKISESGEEYGRLVSVPHVLGYVDLLKNTAIVTSTVLVDRERSGPVRMKSTYLDDFALWLEILRAGRVAVGLQEDLARYRIVRRSHSHSKANSATWVWRTYRSIEGLGRAYAAWCFVNYAVRASWKYRNF